MKAMVPIVAMLVGLAVTGCVKRGKRIEFISISYPSGETNLRVWQTGEARLYYGALPQSEVVAKGALDGNELYESVSDRLHPNVPRENWPDPNAEYGMVQIQFKGEGRKSFLIFNESEWAEAIFEKARSQVVGSEAL